MNKARSEAIIIQNSTRTQSIVTRIIKRLADFLLARLYTEISQIPHIPSRNIPLSGLILSRARENKNEYRYIDKQFTRVSNNP